jgi:hypothetical protein
MPRGLKVLQVLRGARELQELRGLQGPREPRELLDLILAILVYIMGASAILRTCMYYMVMYIITHFDLQGQGMAPMVDIYIPEAQ